MARKKGVTIKVQPDEEEEFPDFGEVALDDVEQASIDGVMQELGDNVVKVYLQRRLPGKKLAWLDAFDVSEFSVEEVARQYGGGKYLARFVGPNSQMLKAHTFYIDEARKPDPKPGDGVTAQPDRSFERELLLTLLAKQQPSDPAAMMAAVGAMMQAQQAAMLPMYQKFAEMLGPQKERPLDELVAVMELGAKLAGGKGESDWMDVARELGVPFLAAMGKYFDKMPAQPNPPPAVAAPARRIEVAAPQEPKTPPPAPPSMWDVIAQWVPKLVDAAQHDWDVHVVSSMVYQNAKPVAAWLEDMVVQPGFEGELLQRFPTLQPHREWMSKLLDTFAALEEEEEEEPGDRETGTIATEGGLGGKEN